MKFYEFKVTHVFTIPDGETMKSETVYHARYPASEDDKKEMYDHFKEWHGEDGTTVEESVVEADAVDWSNDANRKGSDFGLGEPWGFHLSDLGLEWKDDEKYNWRKTATVALPNKFKIVLTADKVGRCEFLDGCSYELTSYDPKGRECNRGHLNCYGDLQDEIKRLSTMRRMFTGFDFVFWRGRARFNIKWGYFNDYEREHLRIEACQTHSYE